MILVLYKENLIMFARLGLVILVAATVGCSSAPNKKVLTQIEYFTFAKTYTYLTKCGVSGQLDVETAALGMGYLRNNLQSVVFDSATMDAVMAHYSDDQPTDTQCRSLAIEVVSQRQKRETQALATAQDRQSLNDAIKTFNSNAPKQTYCNRIGTQTLCTTY